MGELDQKKIIEAMILSPEYIFEDNIKIRYCLTLILKNEIYKYKYSAITIVQTIKIGNISNLEKMNLASTVEKISQKCTMNASLHIVHLYL